MKQLSWIFIVMIFFGWTQEDSPIRCLRMRKVTPMVNQRGFVIGQDEKEMRIYYKGHMRLYMTPYLYDSMVNNRVLKSETRYRYFLFDKDSAFGIYFEPEKNILKHHVALDSFPYVRRFSDIGIFESITSGMFKISSITRNTRLGELTETYVGKEKTAEGTISGKVYLTYSERMKDVELSISKKLDDLKNSKLCQVKILTDPKPNSSKDPYVTLIKIEWVADFNQKLIEEYFKRSDTGNIE